MQCHTSQSPCLDLFFGLHALSRLSDSEHDRHCFKTELSQMSCHWSARETRVVGEAWNRRSLWDGRISCRTTVVLDKGLFRVQMIAAELGHKTCRIVLSKKNYGG
jgi:hypothetical protein